MIELKVNKNIVFFFFLFNTIFQTKGIYHPLGKDLMKKFSDLPSEVKDLQKQYLEGDIPRNPYQYCTLAINTDENLKPKTLPKNYNYGKQTLEIYSEKMYPVVLNIEEKLDFFNTFSKEILPEYERLCKENQKHLGKNVYDELKKFWDLDEDIKLFLIPNILANGGSFGLFRKNIMYSVTSPVLKREGFREFTPQNLISNSIHEFSHSIFKKKLLDLGEFSTFTEKAKNVKIPKELIKKHKNPEIYTEEAFIKAVTHFILVNLYKPFMSLEESKEKEKNILEKIHRDGYIHSPIFYKELKRNNDPISVYKGVLDDMI